MPKKAAAAIKFADVVSRADPEPIAPWKTFKELKAIALASALEKWNSLPAVSSESTSLAGSDSAPHASSESAPAPADAPAKKSRTPRVVVRSKNPPTESIFGIEDARVRRHIDKLGLNASITTFVREMEQKSVARDVSTPRASGESASRASEDTAPEIIMSPEDRDKCDAALAVRVRVGKSAAVYLRWFCEEIANDVIHIAIESALQSGRKVVFDDHIFEGMSGAGAVNARFRGLFEHLPVFIAARDAYMRRARDIDTASAVSAYLSHFRRAIGDNWQQQFADARDDISTFATICAAGAPVAPGAPSTASRDAAADDSGDATAADSAHFTFYITRMTRTIRFSDARYINLKFNNRFIPFIDALIKEFIHLVTMRAIVHTMVTGVETISEYIVQAVILGMMATPSALFERALGPFTTAHFTKRVNADAPAGAESLDGKRGAHLRPRVPVEGDWAKTEITQPAFIRVVDEIYHLEPRAKHARADASREIKDTPTIAEPKIAPSAATPTKGDPKVPAATLAPTIAKPSSTTDFAAISPMSAALAKKSDGKKQPRPIAK